MSDIMKKLNLMNMFPNDIPVGYKYRHLTNFSLNQLELYKEVISSFNFKSVFKDNISMRIIDNATDKDGITIDNYYALYVIYPIKIGRLDAEETKLRNSIEQLKKSEFFSELEDVLKDVPKFLIGISECPDMGFFWRYFDMIKDTKYPHLKFRI